MKKLPALFSAITLILSSYLLFTATAQANQAAEVQSVSAITPGQALTMKNHGVLLIDVREQDEYNTIHVADSTLIPLGELPNRLGEISQHKDKPLIAICRSGKRSAQAVKLLHEKGFTQATSVEGGLIAWEQAGLPVVKK
jgi:rhodanese-related sulfurtransferase